MPREMRRRVSREHSPDRISARSARFEGRGDAANSVSDLPRPAAGCGDLRGCGNAVRGDLSADMRFAGNGPVE
jgi:hypothetical protein